MGCGPLSPPSAPVAGRLLIVTVSPTRDCRTSFTPVIRYPTSPTPSALDLIGSGEITPISNSSCTAPVDIILIRSRASIRPSIIRTYVTTPRYTSYTESKIIARAGAAGSPTGAGNCRTISSSRGGTPSPVSPDTRGHSAAWQRLGWRCSRQSFPAWSARGRRGKLEHPGGQGGLAMVDVGDDAEVPDALRGGRAGVERRWHGRPFSGSVKWLRR